MAQLVAHHTGSVGVRGSNPLSSTLAFPSFLALPLVVVARGFVVSMRVVVSIAGGVALGGGNGAERASSSAERTFSARTPKSQPRSPNFDFLTSNRG